MINGTEELISLRDNIHLEPIFTFWPVSDVFNTSLQIHVISFKKILQDISVFKGPLYRRNVIKSIRQNIFSFEILSQVSQNTHLPYTLTIFCLFCSIGKCYI
jgi:hypothetical protein